jgi:hypothetical protein
MNFHYLLLERPPNCGTPLFVSLKGCARGSRLTAAGMRSLFRHHRLITNVPKANPHGFNMPSQQTCSGAVSVCRR